ncbi:ABC transporter substrate-binding protein [Gemella cuniculi]|uniref:ABC transporter substrate-binding protein n=1 Tax=Gemella cuniculi TaxID=150240 RepID=UPI000416383B|nr:ABC transporter substrate-binding protein [Gemella cuniculi]
MRFSKLKLIFTISLLVLSGCSAKSTQKEGEIKIGVLQYAEHAALASAHEGFIEALDEEGYSQDKVTFDIQNAMGDQSNLQTIAEKLSNKNDLNFVVATPAAQAMINIDKKTPTIFTAVTDPVAASLLTNLEKPEGNITGTIDLTPVDKQIQKLLKIVPNGKKVGVFYNSSEVNSETQAKEAKIELEKVGITVVEKTVTSTNEVQQVITSLANEVDAIYFPTDTTVASTISTIGEVLENKKIPALGGDKAVLGGMLVTYGVDYKEIGRQAGKQAVQILKGKKVFEVPVEKPKKLAVDINEEMARELSLNVDDLKKILED